MVNELHLYSALLTSGHLKHFTILPNFHPFMHTFPHRRRSQPCKATVMLRCLAQGHLDTQLSGAGDRTGNLPVTSQLALPPVQGEGTFQEKGPIFIIIVLRKSEEPLFLEESLGVFSLTISKYFWDSFAPYYSLIHS